jgi:hypothetical protein
VVFSSLAVFPWDAVAHRSLRGRHLARRTHSDGPALRGGREVPVEKSLTNARTAAISMHRKRLTIDTPGQRCLSGSVSRFLLSSLFPWDAVAVAHRSLRGRYLARRTHSDGPAPRSGWRFHLGSSSPTRTASDSMHRKQLTMHTHGSRAPLARAISESYADAIRRMQSGRKPVRNDAALYLNEPRQARCIVSRLR